MPPTRKPTWRDLLAFLNALRHQVEILVCGGTVTALMVAGQCRYGWQITPSMYGVVLTVFFWVAAFAAWFEQKAARDEGLDALAAARRIIDAKRARVEPDIAYELQSGQLTPILYCTNVGEWAARDISLRLHGNTLSPITFEAIQLLTSGARRAPRAFLARGEDIGQALASLALAQYVGAQRAAIRGSLPRPAYDPDIALVINYVDTHSEASITDAFAFTSIEPVTRIPDDYRWIVRRRPVEPEGLATEAQEEKETG